MGNLWSAEVKSGQGPERPVAHHPNYFWEKPGGHPGEVYEKAVYSLAYKPWNMTVGDSRLHR